MRPTKSLATAAYTLGFFAAVSCAPSASDAPRVAFGSSAPIGRWEATQSDATSDEAEEAPVAEAPSGSVAPPRASAAGRGALPAAPAADGGVAQPTRPSQSSGGAAAPAAGSGGSSAADAGGSSAAGSSGAGGSGTSANADLTLLTFEVTTSPAGGRYQPKNIGAIWIEDDAGAVVKTLQVWAGTRRRYLTGYLGAMAGSSIDVTTSATLSRHQTHTLSWDLKDRSGAAVAPGTYHLRMELTDGNQTGKSNTVDFDSSRGPSMLAPSDAPSFGAMKLELR